MKNCKANSPFLLSSDFAWPKRSFFQQCMHDLMQIFSAQSFLF